MKRKLLFVLFYLVTLLVLSGAAMILWNAFLPWAFHLPRLNYYQALGLLVLCKILLGRHLIPQFRSWRNTEKSQHLLKDKLMSMSEEDRAAFKEEWRRRCEPRKK